MDGITLEKIDVVRERTGVTYRVAKEALEKTNGDVVEALIFIEDESKTVKNEVFQGFEEFKEWIKNVVDKGNVTRVRVKKEDKTILNIPVNAGVAVGVLTIQLWPIMIAIGVLTAVITTITVEIVKEDGSVEVVNTIIKNTANDMKYKANDMKEKVNEFTAEVKEKVDDISSDVKNKFDTNKTKVDEDSNVYQYTVNFEDVEESKENQSEETDSKEEDDK
ncbi:DUF4342 domain-containing protein [Clostridium sp. DL1XJH146]